MGCRRSAIRYRADLRFKAVVTLLARKAAEDGLSAACLTDHDLYQGLEEFQAEARKLGLLTIPAMEVSANWRNLSYVHILAYGIDIPGKERFLSEKLRSNWDDHNSSYERIMEKLVTLFSINFSRETIAKKIGQLGPVNFSFPTVNFLEKYLSLEKGEFIDRAFGGHLSFEAAIREGRYLRVEEVMEIIRSAGGKAVLAHPGMFDFFSLPEGKGVQNFEELFYHLVDLGLSGIETYYPRHTPEQTKYFEGLAHRCGLWQTAGSDYHGEYKPNCGLHMPGMSWQDFLRFKDFCER